MSTATAKAVQALHFELPPLPYPEDALAPVISAETLALHHGKHHRKYVDTMNQLLQKEPVRGKTLEDVVRASKGKLFNNAAQAWNHSFYWSSMKPKGGGKPSGNIAKKIDTDLGGYAKFVELFTQAGTTQFGSGWAWLSLRNGKLEVTKTPNAETPLVTSAVPLLTMDVWEHAYYLDFQNRRPDYIKAFLDHLVNWDFANQNLAKA